MSRELPIAKKNERNPAETWEGLTSPLDIDYIETEVNAFYVPALRRLVNALIREIRTLKGTTMEEVIKNPERMITPHLDDVSDLKQLGFPTAVAKEGVAAAAEKGIWDFYDPCRH